MGVSDLLELPLLKTARKGHFSSYSVSDNFEVTILPHMDAAYNLARWLTRDAPAAEDIVQDSFFRAFKSYGSFRGGDARAWILTIVRNTCYTWLSKNRAHTNLVEFNDEIEVADAQEVDPAFLAMHNADTQIVRSAIEKLPSEFREVIVLRELENLSYQEIASVAGVPVGTVMSRLARARKRLKRNLAVAIQGEGSA
jgi:RNA polymerase sigma-70 factor (ECF subfamily)